ncbi:MAG: ammonium transporter [Caulobacter sp.]|nr:ammonium transporter [Caulobacter sp.]
MKNDLIGNFAWAGAIVLVALAGAFARRQGYLDGETVTRMVIGLNGLMIAWQGNRLPKTFVPSACARKARRVAGWSLAVSGLVYAGLFAFAPMQVAVAGGVGAVVTGMAVTFGYCLALRDRAKAA